MEAKRRPWLAFARSRALAVGIVIIAGFVLVTGVTAALTVPAVAITAQESLQQLLPANTAAYLAVDLNPNGTSRDELTSIGRTFAAQPGWNRFGRSFRALTGSRPDKRCLDRAVKTAASTASDHLSYLGHDTAFVLLPSARARPSSQKYRGPSLDQVFARNFVIVAPLDVRLTLADAISGFAFSTPKKALHYRGTSIYRESVPTCSLPSRFRPAAYYAAVFKGYIVVGLTPSTIERIINSGGGHARSLADRVQVSDLTAQMPSSPVASFYINSHVLDRRDGLLERVGRLKLLPSFIRRTLHNMGTVEGASTVSSGSLSLTVARANPYATLPAAPSAGRLASSLPSNTSFYASFRGMKPETRSAVRWLRKEQISRQPTRAAGTILRDVNGELDLTELSSTRFGRGHKPFLVYWRTHRSQAALRADITSALGRLGLRDKLALARLGPAEYRMDVERRGYAVGRGWAMMTSSMFPALAAIRAKPVTPLASVDGYPTAAPATSPYTAVAYLNVAADRHQFNSLLRSLHWSGILSLRRDVPLATGPVETITGTMQNVPGSEVSVGRVTVLFASTSGS